MIKEVDVLYIRNKFSTLLSKLYTDAKISLNDINHKLIYDDFLDCFENNNLDYFINSSYEMLIKDLFNKEIVFNEELNTKVYWSGLQYINIFLNKSIPLKQILLLCPISEMIEYFDIYHELNENELINQFIQNKYSGSILSKLIKNSGYSLKNISTLTKVSINTIKYYQINNDNLFNASFYNLTQIKNVLNVNESLLIKQSNFVPYSNNILEDNIIFQNFTAFIHNYYNIDFPIIKENGLFYFKNKTKKVFIDDKVLISAIKYAISNYSSDKLLF